MELCELLNLEDILSVYIPSEFEYTKINSICHDSRKAAPSSLFVCKVGSAADGHIFAESAYNNGARIFIAEKEIELPLDAAIIRVKSTNAALTKVSEMFYNYPQCGMRLIGITGTKGKTTLALSLTHILNKYGIKTGYIGTNGIIFENERYDSVNTTPDTLELQKYLRLMKDKGVFTCVIEVSSQALWQERIKGLTFDTCIFTNIYRDHIGGSEHPDMQHYINSKKLLFESYGAKNTVYNMDDEKADYMISNTCAENIFSVSASGNKKADIYAENIKNAKSSSTLGMRFDLCFNEKHQKESIKNIFIPFLGKFNIENTLELISSCMCLGVDLDFILKNLSDIKVEGRSEFISLKSKPDVLFCIDYAHNGASLEFLLKSLREYAKNRIILVVGSVGGRTYERRGEIGRVASNLSDIAIITSDNPNFEDPMAIIDDIANEFNDKSKVLKIADRKEAIEKAYDTATDGDIIVLAGKGHEKYQLICGKRLPFCEKEILLELDKQALKTEYTYV